VVAILIKLNTMNLSEFKRSRGLGDTIERITKATGIKKLVDTVSGKKDCGCNKRKEALNKKFPYKK
tara:strand:+ start:1285 stop:1482 length:198 start_codon:yes stop_codon:yes gene_type:complete